MIWIIKRDIAPKYLGAYDWVHTPMWAARFTSLRVARRARDVAREKNSGVRVVHLKTRDEVVHEAVRKDWGVARDRAKRAEDRERDLKTSLEKIAGTPGIPKAVYNIASDALCWARQFDAKDMCPRTNEARTVAPAWARVGQVVRFPLATICDVTDTQIGIRFADGEIDYRAFEELEPCPDEPQRTDKATVDAEDIDDVLDALAASIADCEIDYDDVTSPEAAREAAVELLREVRIGLAIEPTSGKLRREPVLAPRSETPERERCSCGHSDNGHDPRGRCHVMGCAAPCSSRGLKDVLERDKRPAPKRSDGT